MTLAASLKCVQHAQTDNCYTFIIIRPEGLRSFSLPSIILFLLHEIIKWRAALPCRAHVYTACKASFYSISFVFYVWLNSRRRIYSISYCVIVKIYGERILLDIFLCLAPFKGAAFFYRFIVTKKFVKSTGCASNQLTTCFTFLLRVLNCLSTGLDGRFLFFGQTANCFLLI